MHTFLETSACNLTKLFSSECLDFIHGAQNSSFQRFGCIFITWSSFNCAPVALKKICINWFSIVHTNVYLSFGMYSHCISPLYKQCSFSPAARLSGIVKDKSWTPRDMPWYSIVGKHWDGSRTVWNYGSLSDGSAKRHLLFLAMTQNNGCRAIQGISEV